MSDPVEATPSGEPAPVQASASQRTKRKTVATKKPTRASRQASKGASRPGSGVRLKVGGHVIAMPKSLAANLTPKDEKKLVAIFKRILKRAKKDSSKKRAAKKR